jgi:hypothetical protein
VNRRFRGLFILVVLDRKQPSKKPACSRYPEDGSDKFLRKVIHIRTIRRNIKNMPIYFCIYCLNCNTTGSILITKGTWSDIFNPLM